MNIFARNTFILNEYKTSFVALANMNVPRADHSLIYYQGRIFAFGCMNFEQSGEDNDGQIQSLSHSECYNIEKDEWTQIAPMIVKRQAFSACLYNDNHVFICGGKNLKLGASIEKQHLYDYVEQVSFAFI